MIPSYDDEEEDEEDFDDEEQLYERQALINDNKICDDEWNLFGRERRVAIRNRQQMDKTGRSSGYELRNLNGSSKKEAPSTGQEGGQVEFTYYVIQPGDSLHGICLRYACPISTVRRLNQLMTDQDFYGLRRLKLPLGKFGLLEELLRRQDPAQQSDLLFPDSTNHNENNNTKQPMTPIKNSPGSALSVTTRRPNYSQFKPLLSPGYSSDRINELQRDPIMGELNGRRSTDLWGQLSSGLPTGSMQHNSHSFSSLRELSPLTGHINIDINSTDLSPRSASATNNFSSTEAIKQQNFIKSELVPDPSQITIDNLLTDDEPPVKSVFDDLDYHVEKAKAAAESYERRAAEIVNGIDTSNDGAQAPERTTRVSKIPELFFSGENFGLNFKKLIALIIFVCLVIPLIYMNPANIVKQ